MKFRLRKWVMSISVLAMMMACSSPPKVAMVEIESIATNTATVPVKGLSVYYLPDSLARSPGDTQRLERILDAVGRELEDIGPGELRYNRVPNKITTLGNDYSSIGSDREWHVLTIIPSKHVFKCKKDECERKITFNLRITDLDQHHVAWLSEVVYTEPVDIPFDRSRYQTLAGKILKAVTQAVEAEDSESADPEQRPPEGNGS